MDELNDLTKIIENKYNSTEITKDSIYNELMKKEKNIKEVIDRVIKFNKDQEKKQEFLQTSIIKTITNTFKVLNEILEELLKSNKLNIEKIKKIVGIKHRLIYIGIFLIILSVFLAMIEMADDI